MIPWQLTMHMVNMAAGSTWRAVDGISGPCWAGLWRDMAWAGTVATLPYPTLPLTPPLTWAGTVATSKGLCQKEQ